jgi:hypothetical protein
MACRDSPDEEPGPAGRFGEDLIGLDPADPEARAFAAHLDRMEHIRSGLTVEGYLDDVRDFTDSANRASGPRRLVAVLIVLLILFGVCYAAWNAVVFIANTLFGFGVSGG